MRLLRFFQSRFIARTGVLSISNQGGPLPVRLIDILPDKIDDFGPDL